MRLSLTMLIPIVAAVYPPQPTDSNPCDKLGGDCAKDTSFCCDSLFYLLCIDYGYGGFSVLRRCGTTEQCIQGETQISCEPKP